MLFFLICRTIEHIEEEIQLPSTEIPEIFDSNIEDDTIIRDSKMVETLEEAIMAWEKHIMKIIEMYLAKVSVQCVKNIFIYILNNFKSPTGDGPIPEYEYWHEREAGLSILVEQLKKPTILRIMDLLQKAQSDIVSGFDHYKMELMKYYVQARDNVKFLFTVLRHFKVKFYVN